jgi:hypothetical protein
MRYVLLMNASGQYLASTAQGLTLATEACGDEACWRLDRSSADGGAGPVIFAHPATKVSMQAKAAGIPSSTAPGEGVVLAPGIPSACTLRCPRPLPGGRDAERVAGAHVTADGKIVAERGGAGTFLVMHGPDRLPSEYLERLRTAGYCVMPSLIAPPTISELRRVFALDQTTAVDGDKDFASPQGGAQASATVTKVMTHPIVTWLVHEYMHEDEIRLGGGPAIATLQPQQNADGRGGWHSDFPYSGVFATGCLVLPTLIRSATIEGLRIAMVVSAPVPTSQVTTRSAWISQRCLWAGTRIQLRPSSGFSKQTIPCQYALAT